MARMTGKNGKPGTPAFAARIAEALSTELNRIGVKADVSSERVAGTKVYRFCVIAAKFKNLRHAERQGIVWSIVEHALPQDDRLFVSTIVTLTPSELKGAA